MKTESLKFFARLMFIPVSAFFARNLLTQTGGFLNSVLYALTEDSDRVYLEFDTLAAIIQWTFIVWLAIYIALETALFFRKSFRFNRLLTHFRYAPIAIVFLSVLIVTVFDLAMIENSKREIRNYIFSESETVSAPDLRLHNNYRHWCGNGAIAQENDLYFKTAASGIDDENPYVRSRSLLMSARVQNFLNGGDSRFDRFLAKSCSDSSFVVRSEAERYLLKRNSDCRRYLSSR